MKRRYIKETFQITNTHNEIRFEQQFNIAADYTEDKDCYKLLKLTSLPFNTFNIT